MEGHEVEGLGEDVKRLRMDTDGHGGPVTGVGVRETTRRTVEPEHREDPDSVCLRGLGSGSGDTGVQGFPFPTSDVLLTGYKPDSVDTVRVDNCYYFPPERRVVVNFKQEGKGP